VVIAARLEDWWIANAGTRHRDTINNKDRIDATMYPLGTWFVSGICVWIPCIKETMMIMIMIIIIIINIFNGRNNITCSTNCKYRTAATLHTLEKWFVSGI